ncbi:hypothetical protein J7F03_36080 [Streptomyces sp. ISL-43]|uniref:hypothetical protein n=1 Tax=Streptomyces sp. ISL-43 TaxID=2819183 RepID=UPI001BE76DFE|nr:hypothetical protein [Streptomyces sp. ISL-43]MBT2452381.1 hypothetical protein [Streptomyces sp. ISL-43]
MTESASPYLSAARVTVLGVYPGDPPFRIVEIDGEFVSTARSMTDVILTAAAAGITIHDLDDPGEVRWVGGGRFHWSRP